MNKTVRQIVGEWLVANGYDGLVAEDRECGCLVDDLSPCGGDDIMNCEAAYRGECYGECQCEEGGCDFHMLSEKPIKKAAE